MIIPLRELGTRCGHPLTRVLHIGGHYGEECDEYFEQGAELVTFVEPSFTSFAEMHKRIGAREHVVLFHTALGAHNSFGSMYVETANGGQSSSLLRAKVHATQYPQITFDVREFVTVMRCDDLLPAWGVDFIAIDVQGYELEVFKGATETLKSIRAISAEINREELYEGCALVGEVDAFLGERGFDRIATEWCGISWGEAIYTRRPV
jgi:FkbM family methyltransferase